jgi:hypothetical protein
MFSEVFIYKKYFSNILNCVIYMSIAPPRHAGRLLVGSSNSPRGPSTVAVFAVARSSHAPQHRAVAVRLLVRSHAPVAIAKVGCIISFRAQTVLGRAEE